MVVAVGAVIAPPQPRELNSVMSAMAALDPNYREVYGITQSNLDEGLRRFRAQFATPPANPAVANPDVGANPTEKEKFRLAIDYVLKLENSKSAPAVINAPHDITNGLRVLDLNFPAVARFPVVVNDLFSSKEKAVIDAFTRLAAHHAGNINDAYAAIDAHIVGGLDNSGPRVYPVGGIAFSDEEKAVIKALESHTPGNIGKALKAVNAHVNNPNGLRDVVGVVVNYKAVSKNLMSEEQVAAIDALKVLDIVSAPTEAVEGIKALIKSAKDGGHSESPDQLSEYLNSTNRFRRLPAQGDFKKALVALSKLPGAEGSPDRGLRLLQEAFIEADPSVVALNDLVNPNKLAFDKAQASLNKAKTKAGNRLKITGVDGTLSREALNQAVERSAKEDPVIIALNRELRNLENPLEEKEAAYEAKQKEVDKAVEKHPQILEINADLKAEKDARIAAEKQFEADATALVKDLDTRRLTKNFSKVDSSLLESDKAAQRVNAIIEAREEEKAMLAAIKREVDAYNLAPDDKAKAAIVKKINRITGDESYGDEVSAGFVKAAERIADIFSDKKGEVLPSKKESELTLIVKQVSGDTSVESRAEKIFGELNPQTGMGRIEDFIYITQKALKADTMKDPVPDRLKDLLETGSKDSQAFYKAAFQEVVWKQMTGEEKANLATIYLNEKDGNANSATDLPDPNSLQGIFYAVAKRGGFLDSKLENVKDITDQIAREKQSNGKGAAKSDAKTSGEDLDEAHDVLSRNVRGYLDRKKAGKLYDGRLSEQEGRIEQLESELKKKGHEVPDPIIASSSSNSGRLGSSDTSSSSYEARLEAANSQQSSPSLADVAKSLEGKTVADYSTKDLLDMIKAAVRETVTAMQARNMAPMFHGAPAGNMSYAQGGYYGAPSPFTPGLYGNMGYQMSPTAPLYPQGCPIQQPMLNYGGQSWVPYGNPSVQQFSGPSQQAFNGYSPQQFSGPSNGQASFQNIDESALTAQTADRVFAAMGRDNPISGAKGNSSAGTLNSQSSTDFGASDSSERSESVSKRSALASSRLGIVNEDELKEYLSPPNGSRANSESNILLKEIRGSGRDGKFEILGSGIAVARYENYATFAKHVEEAAKKKFTDGTCESITGEESDTLVSIAKIKAGNRGFSYQVVVSDPRGVRSHSISENDYKKLVESDKTITSHQERLLNKDKLMASIQEKFAMEDPENSQNHKLIKEDQKILLNGCSNQFYLPGSPFASGRKNKLKEMIKNASVTTSNRDEIVVERNRKDNSMVTVSINGNPTNSDGNPKSTYVGVGNDCFIKVNAEYGIIQDSVFKREDDGSYKKINIDSEFFGIGKGSTLAKELGDSEAAKSVIDRFYNTKIIVVKNKGHDQEGNETPKVLQFLANGKTHGLKMSRLEKTIVYPLVTTALITASVFTGGLATAGVGVAALGVAAAAFGGAAAPATFGVIAGSSTLGGLTDRKSTLDEAGDHRKSTLDEAGDQVFGSGRMALEAISKAFKEGSVSKGYGRLAEGAQKRMAESRDRSNKSEENDSKRVDFAQEVFAAPVKIASNTLGLVGGILSTPVVAVAGVVGWMAGNKPSSSPKERDGGFEKNTSQLTNKQKVAALNKVREL